MWYFNIYNYIYKPPYMLFGKARWFRILFSNRTSHKNWQKKFQVPKIRWKRAEIYCSNNLKNLPYAGWWLDRKCVPILYLSHWGKKKASEFKYFRDGMKTSKSIIWNSIDYMLFLKKNTTWEDTWNTSQPNFRKVLSDQIQLTI